MMPYKSFSTIDSSGNGLVSFTLDKLIGTFCSPSNSFIWFVDILLVFAKLQAKIVNTTKIAIANIRTAPINTAIRYSSFV